MYIYINIYIYICIYIYIYIHTHTHIYRYTKPILGVILYNIRAAVLVAMVPSRKERQGDTHSLFLSLSLALSPSLSLSLTASPPHHHHHLSPLTPLTPPRAFGMMVYG